MITLMVMEEYCCSFFKKDKGRVICLAYVQNFCKYEPEYAYRRYV